MLPGVEAGVASFASGLTSDEVAILGSDEAAAVVSSAVLAGAEAPELLAAAAALDSDAFTLEPASLSVPLTTLLAPSPC